MASSGDLVTKEYKDFRGVDFNIGKTSNKRSPFSLNMWINYKNNAKCIETRPDLEELETYDNTIYGMFFYTKDDTLHKIVHSGTKLYDNGTEIFTGMNIIKSNYFVFKEILYIKDGINYLKYDGEEIKEVEGYVPTTSIGKSPSGAGSTYQDVNLLTGVRINSFVGDGESTEYQLDVEEIDSDYVVTISVDGMALIQGQDFSVDVTKGKITFNTPPAKPVTTGQDNVLITFRKTVDGYRDRILKCTMLTEFDNRIFFSGNINYPNTIFHSSLENPEYVSDLDYYNEGDEAPVKAMVAGNNALWVFKEPSQANTSIFYHNPTIDSTYGKIYPSTHSSISTGCVSTGVNFNDDIVFFSDRGLEGISSDVTTEQVVGHRSSMIDNKLLSEQNYKNLQIAEWEGYLLVFIDNKVYLADSRGRYRNVSSIEYEWFYWELKGNVTYTMVKDNILYVAIDNTLYSLTKTNENIESIWTIPKEDFGAPQLLKTTNKRGGVAVCEGTIKVRVKTDNNDYEDIDTYEATKGYVVYRIKKKKFKDLMIEFSSDKPMKLYSATIESFIGGYVKR